MVHEFPKTIERVGFRQLTIKNLSDTGWVYHYICAHVLKECFGSVVRTMHMIIKDHKSNPQQKAVSKGTLLQLKSWNFMFWVTALMEILTGVNTLNELLQKKKDTLWKALRELETCREIIGGLRSDEVFMKVWSSSLEFAEKYDIVAPYLHHDSDSVTGKRKRVPKVHTDFVGTGLDGMSRSHNLKFTFK